MWKQIFCLENCISIYTLIFVLVWFAAWILNGFQYAYFDLDRLLELYAWLMTQLNATYAINSIWNSPRGCLIDRSDRK